MEKHHLEYRALGKTNLRCSILGFGTSKLTSVSSKLSRRQAIRLILVAADNGINFVDTADSYGQGDSEIVLGEAIKGKRGDFIVASKVGYRFDHIGKLIAMAKPFLKPVLRPFRRARSVIATIRTGAGATSLLQQDFSPAYLERAINDSLRRLGTDYLDILYLHDIPLMAARADAVFEALNRIQSAGKVRYIGFSADDRAVLETALNSPTISVIQTAVHSLRPTSLWPTLSTLAEAGIGVVANHIFGSGPALSIEEDPSQGRLLEIARNHGMSLRQTMIGFAAIQPSVCSVLIGTTSPEHLKENVADFMSARRIFGAKPIS